MKKIFLSVFIGFMALCLNAQENTTQSLITLHDGSQLKGQVTENQSFGNLTLKIIGGTELTIPRKSVKSIIALKDDLHFFENGKFVKTNGLYKIISTGISPAWDEDGEYIQWGANIIHGVFGYQFNQYLSVGGGLGLDIYSNTFFPLYLDFRGYIFQKSVSPYYALQTGYSFSNDLFNNFSENVNFKGGPMLHPSVGLRFASFRKTKFLLEAGYKFQWDTRTYDWNENVDKIIFKRLAIKIGLQF